MTADFHEVSFPLRLALQTSGGPVRRTEIVRLSNGLESRNARWAQARRRYDVGSSVKTLDDLYEVIAFFEARRGQLHGFRFRDPLDHRSGGPNAPIAPTDQVIGVGDGERATFQLSKRYGDAAAGSDRPIAKPVAGTVQVALDGVTVASGDLVIDSAAGTVTFASGAPPAGVIVTAGFEFDVPVRFDIDRVEVHLTAFRAGQVPSITLVEIRP